MIGCLQTIIALYFEFETVLKFYNLINLKACLLDIQFKVNIHSSIIKNNCLCFFIFFFPMGELVHSNSTPHYDIGQNYDLKKKMKKKKLRDYYKQN